jgi:hypothetical protein
MKFESLKVFSVHLNALVQREILADCAARGAVAKDITVLAQGRLGKPWPGVWPALAESTKLVHRLHGVLGGAHGGDSPLIVTGRLRESISWAHTGSRESGVGSSAPYAIYHEFGGHIPGRPPRRSFLAAPAREKNDVLFKAYQVVYLEHLKP